MFMYAVLPGVRSRSATLLMWMLACQLGLSFSIVAYFCPKEPSHSTTVAVSFFINFFTIATMFWSVAVMMTMSFVIVQRNWLLQRLSSTVTTVTPMFGSSGRNRMLRFHAFVWLCSLFFSIIPLAVGSYDTFSEDWYWFKYNDRGDWIGFACYYLPLAGGVFGILMCF